MRIGSILLLAFCVNIFFSCNSRNIYQEKKDFTNRFWIFNDQANFEFDIQDTTDRYNLWVNVRNSSKYQYQNIYLQYYLEDSTGRLLSKDLKNVQLFHEVTGVSMGEGMGDLFDVERVFLKNYSFKMQGKHIFRIDQFMRQDSLPEILSVGLRIEKAKEN